MHGNLDISLDRLSRWCEDHVDGFRGPINLQKFAIGQSNPTYLLHAQSDTYVLRRKPPGVLLKSAHAVDREYRVMDALGNTPVPVPKMYALCEQDNIIGSIFFIMEYIPGRTLLDPSLPEMTMGDRYAIYEAQVEILANLASLNVIDLGLEDYGRPGNYVERQVSRWTKQYRAAETETIPEMENLIAWLPQSIPSDMGEIALVHGDFRLDNLLIHPTGPRIMAVVDWELSTLGHPFVDFSYWGTMLGLPRDTYHRGLRGINRKGIGIPTERELLRMYCQMRGIDEPNNWSFWVAFHSFRFTAIVQGVMKRHLDGNASSPEAFEVGSMARPVAKLGWDMAAHS